MLANIGIKTKFTALIKMGFLLIFIILNACDSGGDDGFATCHADDLDCFIKHLEVADDSLNDIKIIFVDSTIITTLSDETNALEKAPFLTSGPVSIDYPNSSVIPGVNTLPQFFDFTYVDPNGCRPVMCFGLSSGSQKSKNSGCWGGAHDGLTSGSFSQSIGWKAEAPEGAGFNVNVTPIASENCANIHDPKNLITGDGAYPLGGAGITAPGVTAGPTEIIPVTIAPLPKSTGGSGGGTCYGTWDCKGSSQCASVMGSNTGTAGPFSSLSQCDNWRQTQFIGGVCSCN